jgi:predicted AAA+ superfamily ATPase
MLSNSEPTYRRRAVDVLAGRLREPRRFIQVVAGPRQVGKTTAVQQAAEALQVPVRYATADEPTLRGPDWIAQQWDAARIEGVNGSAVLVLDEIQKVGGWSEAVKRLWDEDTRVRRDVRVVLLGSAPLLVRRGLSESLTGRFEVIRLSHWSFGEMRDAFGFSLDDYLYFGGYPGAASLIDDPPRWARYILDSLIETTISRDVLLLSRVDKPALLRRLFELASRYSGQIRSYTKMLGQLQDAGNSTTLAHYLDLLGGAGLIVGVPKFAGAEVRQRGSSPKLQVLNTALMTAQSGLSPEQARSDRAFWGRLVESAVGAHLANDAITSGFELFYWRDRNREVDFVTRRRDQLTALEVKSGRTPETLPGMRAFTDQFHPSRTLLVGGDGIALETFLAQPANHWVGSAASGGPT